jgi:hypothetical protein
MLKYLIVGVGIICSFLYIIFFVSLGIPSFDDYYATVSLVKQYYFDNPGFKEKIELLFARHNEHRIVVSRLTTVIYYGLFQKINFVHLVIFQNIFLFGFIFLIIKLYKKERQFDPVTFLLIVIFLCSTSFWQVSNFYWAGIQHFVIMFFSFASLIVLDKTEKIRSLDFLLAVLLAILAVLSFGNGFLVLLMGIFLLFAKRKYAILGVWTTIAILLIVYSLFGDKGDTVLKSSFNPEWMARLLFTFLGSFFYVNWAPASHANIVLCMIVGICVLGFWVWLFFSKYAFRKPLLYSLLSLPILSAIIISISRFEAKSAGGIAPRYMFFSAIIPVIIVLILLDLKLIKREKIKYAFPVLLPIWAFMFYNNYHSLKQMNEEQIAVTEAWKQNKQRSLVYYDQSDGTSKVLQWATCNQVIDHEIYEGACDSKGTQ